MISSTNPGTRGRVAPDFLQRNKKWLYPFFLIVPALPVVSFRLGGLYGSPDLFAFLTPLIIFGLLPVLDHLIGRDPRNPSPEDIAPLNSSLFLNALPFIAAALFVALMIWGGWVFASTAWSGIWGPIGWTVSIGIVGSILAINVAHELIHKRSKTQQITGGILLATVCYGSFKVEHLRGHHRWVATAEDPSSARAGETLYQFVPKAIRLNFINAWKLESARLSEAGAAVLGIRNELLWWNAISVLLAVGFWWLLGPAAVVYFLAQALIAISLLETVNYLEHYGLSRPRLASGRFAPPDYRHSWNSDYLLSNLMLFQLQRHADHHMNPSKPYQVLETIEASPQLPAGYSTMVLAAFVPPLWRRIMDPRLPPPAQD